MAVRIQPGKIRVGDEIVYEEKTGDIVISRRGIVGRIVENRRDNQRIASSAGGRVLFVWDFTARFPGNLYLLKSSELDTMTELPI